MRRILINEKNEFPVSEKNGGSKSFALKKLGTFFQNVEKKSRKDAENKVVVSKSLKSDSKDIMQM